MESSRTPEPTIFVIFGAAGDLTRRKLIPALYNLFLDHHLPERFRVIGVDKSDLSEAKFHGHLRQGIDRILPPRQSAGQRSGRRSPRVSAFWPATSTPRRPAIN